MLLIHTLLSVLVLVSAFPQSDADRSQATTGRPAPSPEPVAIPMELLASRPLVRVTVNGQGPFAFLLGPEDQTTLIDAGLAEMLKVRERPSAEGAPELAVELGFGSNKPVKIPVRVADIAGLMPEFAPEVRPRGIISLSAWKDHLVTIDYARYRVTVAPGALPEPNGKDVFALTASRELRLPLSIAEHSVDCRVDPLFHGGLLLPPSFVDLLPIDGANGNWRSFNTRARTLRVKEARLATNLMLGPFELKAPQVLLADSGDTATIGAQWLGRFSVTYDLANARARLERPRPSTDK